MLVARTDADAADMITSDVDERDAEFITGERTEEGFYRTNPGVEQAIARALAYAPYADLIWCETSEPDYDHARQFAEAVHEQFPDQKLAYNCSPSFNWKSKLSDDEIASFQDELAKLGYVFQFVTLAGFHSLNLAMFELADGYREGGMAAFSALQQKEFAAEDRGFTATKHQRQVGAGYFDDVRRGHLGRCGLDRRARGSTESSQF